MAVIRLYIINSYLHDHDLIPDQDAEDLLGDLVVVFDQVVPCFPEKYQIFDVFHRAYHKQFSRMVHVLGWHASRLSNSDILAVRSKPFFYDCFFSTSGVYM